MGILWAEINLQENWDQEVKAGRLGENSFLKLVTRTNPDIAWISVVPSTDFFRVFAALAFCNCMKLTLEESSSPFWLVIIFLQWNKVYLSKNWSLWLDWSKFITCIEATYLADIVKSYTDLGPGQDAGAWEGKKAGANSTDSMPIGAFCYISYLSLKTIL